MLTEEQCVTDGQADRLYGHAAHSGCATENVLCSWQHASKTRSSAVAVKSHDILPNKTDSI